MTDKSNGRDNRGRFQRGCAAGPGRPRHQDLRRALADLISMPLDGTTVEVALRDLPPPDSVGAAVVRRLVERAVLAGDRRAVVELLNRCERDAESWPFEVDASDLASLSTAGARVLASVAEGSLSVDRAGEMFALLARQTEILKTVDLEREVREVKQKLEALEQAQAEHAEAVPSEHREYF